ncbi:MAG: PLP-dependent aminotransferase family protein [Bacillota bacterium]
MRVIKKYDRIVSRIQDLVSLGTLKDGECVPSVRSMAKQAGVSIMTVLEGYRRLEDMGLIEGRPRSGYYVRPQILRSARPWVRPPEASQSGIELRTEAVIIPEAIERLAIQSLKGDVFPLGAGMPAPDYFPNDDLSIHLARVARSSPEYLNRYNIGGGDESLREMISKWMIEAGCITREDEILVTSGATQALMLALRAVARPGDIVAVESPGYYGFYGLLQFFSLRAVEIPCNPQSGLDVNTLHTLLQEGVRPACVLLSSSYSNPTGASMPDVNKEKLAELCACHSLPVIEDDTFGELTFDSYRPRPIKAISPNTVLYVGSFSKMLAPGYRVAWLAGGRHTDDIRRCYGMSVLATPAALQMALASYLKNGGLKSHLRRLRKQYEENIGLFQNKVARCFPGGTRTSSPRGGYFLWVELPSGHDAVVLSHAAINDGISIAPGVLFSSRQHYKRYFRLNCSVKWSDEVEKAIERLGELAVDATSTMTPQST